MNKGARCTEPGSATNARGAQHAPRRAGPAYRAPVVGSYDRTTGTVRYGDPRTSRPTSRPISPAGGAAGALIGEESWRWLLRPAPGGGDR